MFFYLIPYILKCLHTSLLIKKKSIFLIFRPDYISPLDDLAFDMYQDPEIAGIIRKLEKKKQEAVLRMLYL